MKGGGAVGRRMVPPGNIEVGLLLGIFLVLGVASLPHTSLTTDEPLHYRYGRKILASDAGRFDDSKMPISALNALPAWVGEHLPDSRLARGLRHFQVARLPTLLAAAALGYGVFVWSRRLYGPAAGLLSLFLYTFDPNILAHARLITTDLYAAAAFTLSLYFFWRFARRRTVGRAVVAALVVGAAQVTKYTAVALFPLLAVIIAAYDLPRIVRTVGRRRWKALGRYVVWSVLLVAVFLGAALVMINVAFLREFTFTPLQDYAFRSRFFQEIQSGAANAAWIRVPVPYPYLQGLDDVLHRERSGAGYGQIYLLGQLRHGEGFPGYFLIATLLKMPIAAQAILALSLAVLFAGWSWRRVLRSEQFLLVPLLGLVVYFNFLFRAQIGIRLILMVFPMLHVLSGRLVQRFAGGSGFNRIGWVAGLAWIAWSTLSYHPDYLAYFNEIVWDRRLAYLYLGDSNLDWGQSETFLKEYLASHPEAQFEPEELTPGEIIVRVNNLVGITADPRRYAPLREECVPSATIGHAYLVYQFPCAQEGIGG